MGMKSGELCGNGDGITHIVRNGTGPMWTYCDTICHGMSREYQRPATCIECVVRWVLTGRGTYVPDSRW